MKNKGRGGRVEVSPLFTHTQFKRGHSGERSRAYNVARPNKMPAVQATFPPVIAHNLLTFNIT